MLLFPLGFLRYVLLKVAAFSCLNYCLAYAFVVVFSNTQRLFVPNKCVWWLQSRRCFTAIFLSPDSIERFFNQRLNFPKFLLRPGLVYNLFCGSGAEVVLRPSFVS